MQYRPYCSLCLKNWTFVAELTLHKYVNLIMKFIKITPSTRLWIYSTHVVITLISWSQEEIEELKTTMNQVIYTTRAVDYGHKWQIGKPANCHAMPSYWTPSNNVMQWNAWDRKEIKQCHILSVSTLIVVRCLQLPMYNSKIPSA